MKSYHFPENCKIGYFVKHNKPGKYNYMFFSYVDMIYIPLYVCIYLCVFWIYIHICVYVYVTYMCVYIHTHTYTLRHDM